MNFVPTSCRVQLPAAPFHKHDLSNPIFIRWAETHTYAKSPLARADGVNHTSAPVSLADKCAPGKWMIGGAAPSQRL